MFGNMGVHVDKNPAGTYGFVGTLPLALSDPREPTAADVMAGRVWYDRNGKSHGYRFPVFATRAMAMAHARTRGVDVAEDK